MTPRASQEPHGGVTIDQIAAQHIGQDTPLPSLEVATEGRGGGGACDRDYGCSYGAHDLVPHADDAAADGVRSAQAVRAAVRPGRHAAGAQGDRRSSTRASSTWSRRRPHDLQRTSTRRIARGSADYLESVREIERRVQKMEAQDLSSLDLPDVPVGTPTFDQRLNLMFDMIALAYQANLTRVFTFMMAAEVSRRDLQPHRRLRRVPPAVASPERQGAQGQAGRRSRPITSRCSRSSSTSSRRCRTATASMLDHSILLYGSNMSNSNAHNQFPLPTVVVGGGCGKIKGGQHLKYPGQDAAGESAADAARAGRRSGGQGRQQHAAVLGDLTTRMRDCRHRRARHLVLVTAARSPLACSPRAAARWSMRSNRATSATRRWRSIAKRVDVNAPEADGTTALHWAVHQNDLELVDRLIAPARK